MSLSAYRSEVDSGCRWRITLACRGTSVYVVMAGTCEERMWYVW